MTYPEVSVSVTVVCGDTSHKVAIAVDLSLVTLTQSCWFKFLTKETLLHPLFLFFLRAF